MEDELVESSTDDSQYRAYVREKIERGLEDIEAGRFVDDDEVDRRLKRRLVG
jgi:predicted transcriptional regulator